MPILDWRELQNLVEQKQTGDVNGASEINKYSSVTPEEWDDFDSTLKNYLGSSKGQQMQAAVAGRDAARDEKEEFADQPHADDGYGEYRKDLRIPYDEWVKDPVNYRANLQSRWAKFGNGVLKAIPYTATTFLDNTVGLVAGLADLAIGSEVPGVSKEGHSFVNTQFGEIMQGVRDWSEKVLPNYRTQEELDEQDEWWKHLNANFWGDTFLKNLGFTIGAGLSGAAYAKGFRALQGQLVNKAYKAAVAASAAGDVAAEEAFQKVLQGAKFGDTSSIYRTFSDVNKSFNRLGVESQMVGGIGGAIGESRVEALSAAKEFRDEYEQNTRLMYEQAKNQLVDKISSDPQYIDYQDVYDGYGNVVGKQPVLNATGQKAMQSELTALQDKYTQTMNVIDKEAEKLANSTFWMNMPLLTASNIVMFGRMFSGGFKTQAKTKVRGLFGNYKQAGSTAVAIGKGLGNTLTEGMEELSQKIISEGSKDIAKYNVAEFHNGKYDENSIKGVSEWLMSMLDSAGNVISDPTSWQEFAVGALTGALGMPTRHGWTGGIYGGVKEGLAERDASKKAAEDLNKRISDPAFKNLWQGIVRHNTLEEKKNADLKAHDSFAWHTDDDAEMISDVMMFANAGRLNDLEAFVDSVANVSLEDIAKIKDTFADSSDPEFANHTDAYYQKWLKERAKAVKKTINQVRDLRDSIDTLSYGTTSEEALNELVYAHAQLQNFEERYSDLLDKTIAEIRPYVENVSRETDAEGKPTKRAENAQKLLASEDGLSRIFGGYAMDIHGRAQDEKAGIGSLASAMLDDTRQEEVLNTLEEWGAFTDKPELKQQVSDLQRLVRSRQDYYAKLFDPKFRQTFNKEFNEKAETDESAAAKQAAEARANKVQEHMTALQEATSLGEFVSTLNDILDNNTDPEIERQLGDKIDADERLSKYNKTVNDAIEFIGALQESIDEKNESAETATETFDLADLANALQEVDLNAVFASMKDDDNPIVSIAKELLTRLASSPGAEKIARNILQEKFSDIAKANSLGPIPGAGEGEGGGPGEGGGGGSTVTHAERILEVLEHITDINDTLLNKIAEGDFSEEEYNDISMEERLDLANKAAAILARLKEKYAATRDPGKDKRVIDDSLDTDGEKSDDDPRHKEAQREFTSMDTKSINGSKFSIYSIKNLLRGVVSRFTSKNAGTNATLNWMRRHKVQEFVDSGALAKLEQAYRENHPGQKLPIYFLGNPHFEDNNLDNNPFAINYIDGEGKTQTAVNLLLAVEMNDENRKVLAAYEKAGLFSDDTLITVNENGRDVQYQVIGELWNPTPEEVKKGGEAYKVVKEKSNLIWDHAAANSIKPQYKADVEKASTAAFGKEGKWYVGKIHPSKDIEQTDTHTPDWSTGERMFTTLNYIMSGRNETREKVGDEYKKIPLATSLTEYKSFGGKYYFAIPAKGEILYSSSDSPSLHAGINAPQGSLWMATQEANGGWSWTYVTIASTDEGIDYDADNALMRRFNAALKTIFDKTPAGTDSLTFAKDQHKRIAACRVLDEIIYLGNGNVFSVTYSSSGPKLYVGGAECGSREEVINALVNGKYRFQVSIDSLRDSEAMDDLINAGVLRSEMRSFIRHGATIGVNFMDDTVPGNEEQHVDPYVVDSSSPVARTAGELISAPDTGGINNIRIGNAGYRLEEDGSVTRMGSPLSPGEKVTSKEIIAQVKAIAELIEFGKSAEPDVAYPGKQWNVSNSLQYSDMYEREIDGIVVRLVRRGRNGAIKLVYSPMEWESMMLVAKPVVSKYKTSMEEQKSADAEAEDMAALNRARDEQLAAEEGGTVTPPSAPKKKRKGGWGAKAASKDASPGSKTVQEKTTDDAKKEEDDNCGDGTGTK